ncbi:MAG: ASCH domain-containing protein [Desulforudis sp.]|jgi:hypothetical protein|nr:MAG: ASCH domain-containing protein [Desulforudis sp.]
MKALTLTQPWATLLAHGIKTIETRSWSTKYRGWIAIHAAKGFPPKAKQLCFVEPFFSFLTKCGYIHPSMGIDLPLGKVIAKAHLLHVTQIPASGHRYWVYNGGPLTDASRIWIPPGEPELSFGDYTPGRFAWIFGAIVRLPEPIPAKGALGLWSFDQLLLDGFPL